MSERDLDQKLELRRAFWAMGASTRLDVKLGALIPQERGRAGSEEWTDLDVLAVEYSPLIGLSHSVADCKTVKGRVAERVFWLRGVADLFDARAVFLARDDPLPASARQLAVRLGIAALDARDRAVLLEQAGDTGLPRVGGFLDRETFVRWNGLVGTSSKTIDRLQRYRSTIYWLVPHHRNLTYLVGEVQRVRKELDWHAPASLALVLDLAWLYLLAVLGALDDMTRLQLADQNAGLRFALLGGEQEAQRQEWLAGQLRKLLAASRPGREPPSVPVLPEYYGELSTLLTRVARRRADATTALRVLEFVGAETVANRGATWQEAFPGGSPYGPKLASDVVQFLLVACGLDHDFLDRFDNLLDHRLTASKREPMAMRQVAAVQTPLFEAAGEGTVPASALPDISTKRAPDQQREAQQESQGTLPDSTEAERRP